VLEDMNPGPEELEYAAKYIESTPALEAAHNVCTVLVNQAIDQLDDVEWIDNSYSEDLKDLAVYGGLVRPK
jgi:geranylgeranyl pyrophosphate synthase